MFRRWRKTDEGFFAEFEKEIEEMNKIIESMARTPGSAVYGMRVEIGPDGVPHVEHFGNIIPAGKDACTEKDLNDIREPFTSSMIDEKNNELNITAEMPGIKKEDIEVSATENEVLIKAGSGVRKYYKSVKTPAIDPDSASAKYNNGVLEVTLKLKENSKQIGKAVIIK